MTPESPKTPLETFEEELLQRIYGVGSIESLNSDDDANDVLAIRQAAITYGDERAREALEERHNLIVKKFKKLVAAIFAVKFYLDQPYPDDARWTPYTRFISPRLKALEAAITKGEDLGDLAALAALPTPGAAKAGESGHNGGGK